MKNIVLARIDDRLIHGQVVVSWIGYVKANEIVVIDDEIAKDDFLREIVKSSAPGTITVNVFTEKESIVYLNKLSEEERILVLTKTPQTYQNLIEKGIKLPTINLGGVGSESDRKRIYKSISLSEKEINCLKRIYESGVKVEIQILPNDRPIKFCEVI